jgi:hypothetical protein
MNSEPEQSRTVIQLAASQADKDQSRVAIAVIFFDSEIFESEICCGG